MPYVVDRFFRDGVSKLKDIYKKPLTRAQRIEQMKNRFQQSNTSSTTVFTRSANAAASAIRTIYDLAIAVNYFLFFWSGSYRSIVARLLSLRSVSIESFSDDLSLANPNLRIISYLMISQYSLDYLYSEVKNFLDRRTKNRSIVKQTWKEGVSCVICLSDPILNPSCGPCGHLFCYHCLLGVTISKSMCPTCRTQLRPQQVRCLVTRLPEIQESN